MSTIDDPRRADALAQAYLHGAISRRDLLRRAGKFGAGAVGASMLAQVLAACGGASTSSSSDAAVKPVSGGKLMGALTGEPDSLDPAKSQIYTGAQVYDNVFSKLVNLDEQQQPYGVLATKWTQKDSKTWVFDLREGVRFHNGETFSSADVKYTFERILDPKTASGYAGLYSVIDKIETPSPTQVVFRLKSSFGPFLTNLANNGEIVNAKAIASGNPDRKPVGTGPYTLEKWAQGDRVVLRKFDGYFMKGEPYLDSIELRFLPVDQSRVDALRSGELDWADAIPLQQVGALKSDPAFRYATSKTAGIPDFLAMNTKKAPFDKKEVRQAVAYAVDREAIRKIAYFGTGENGQMEVPSGSQWYDESGDPFLKRDVDKARQLMQQAGVGDVTVEYLGLPQYPELLKTGEVVRENLKDIGITMNIKQVDVSVWFDRFSKGNYQITSAYQERTIDPDNFYSLVLKTGGPINTTFYSNKQLDDLIDQAAAETDESKRKQLYGQIRKIVWEDAPLTFVHYETLNYLMRSNVHGSKVTPTLELNFGKVFKTGGASS